MVLIQTDASSLSLQQNVTTSMESMLCSDKLLTILLSMWSRKSKTCRSEHLLSQKLLWLSQNAVKCRKGFITVEIEAF